MSNHLSCVNYVMSDFLSQFHINHGIIMHYALESIKALY